MSGKGIDDTELTKWDPVDIAARFGKNPNITEVDSHVRSLMQNALDRLARERRFPVLG